MGVNLPSELACAHNAPHTKLHHVMTFNALTWNFLQTEACYSESSGIHW